MMVLVVDFFRIFDFSICFVVAIFDLVHDLDAMFHRDQSSFTLYHTPFPLYSKTDKGAIGSNTCHLPEAVTSVSHVRMTNNLHHFVQK